MPTLMTANKKCACCGLPIEKESIVELATYGGQRIYLHSSKRCIREYALETEGLPQEDKDALIELTYHYELDE